MSDPVRRVRRPCVECPWRTDAQPQRFPRERFEHLANTSRQADRHTGHDADVDAPFFACHMTPEGGEASCAGWLAVEGRNHVGVRMAVVTGRLEQGCLVAGEGWPQLYGSFVEMVAAQGY